MSIAEARSGDGSRKGPRLSVLISVVGWEKFQHYKDRDPPWVKLYRDLLTTESWVVGTDHSRLMQVASILLAARYENQIPYRWDLIKKVSHLDFSEAQFKAAVQHLVEYKFLEFQGVTSDLNVVAQSASTTLAKCSSEAIQSRGNTETEQTGSRSQNPDAQTTPDPPRRRTRTKSSAVPISELHGEIVGAYHEICAVLPRIARWTVERRDLLDACIQERCAEGRAANTPEYWRGFFENVAASDFLCGRVTRWRADLQWLLTPEKFLNVVEGKYANNKSNGQQSSRHQAYGGVP